ncbi:Subtilisin-like protease 6 [Oopsacas minuta]|uniref:Subtilisin-like protease 6 n=1 Tax=Oopsacas minuta TaxID=111878 RepID=A0AAV7JTX5_9METZ|nr:Subtilisin-like protease 6 [Oopsacas minuta]
MIKSQRNYPIYPNPLIATVSEGITYGHLRKPIGVCVESTSQDIYITDIYTREVKVFSKSADYRFKFHLLADRTEVAFPYKLAISDGFVFVSDYDRSIVGVFSLNGDFVTYFNGGLYKMQFAKGIAIDSDGDLYICDSGNNRVFVFCHSPPYYFQYLHHELLQPKDISIFNNKIYVIDFDIVNLKIFTFSGELSTILLESNPFSSIFFTIDLSGYFIFSDQGCDRLLVFSPDGIYIQSIGTKGMNGPGEFNIPRGITVDGSNRIITEGSHDCIQSTKEWNLDILDGSDSSDSCLNRPDGLTGKSVSVYVMDTGIMYEHTQFEGRARYPGFDIVDQYFSEKHEGRDTHGHGTSVSGVIGGRDLGVAPGVDLFSVRILKSDISGSWGMFADGIEQILSHRELQRHRSPCIVSASVFGEMHYSSAGWRYTLMNSIRELVNAGCVFVTIAGNDGKSACEYLPANLTLPIVVGGTTPAQTVMTISNYGPCVDLFAPGKDIKSASLSCSTCTDTFTGTSYAGPHVTGIAAIQLEKCPTLTHNQIKQNLIQQSLKGILNIHSDQSPSDTPNRLIQIPNSICECRIRD